jgi:GMP synthase (glutamine-hydrolysing)
VKARLLVIQHEDEAPPGWWGDWLDAAEIELAVVLAHRGEPLPEDLSEYDGLLVLGGAMGAYDDDRCPWLTPTKQLIAATVVRTDKAFLGICLGHQLAAVALGGTVARNPAGTAIGLRPVELTESGRADPLFRWVERGARAVHWNDDVVTTMPASSRVTMPGRSTVLAVAPDGSVQAARYGLLAWGVQFHPEVSPEVFASWGVPSEKSAQPGPDEHTIATAAQQIAEAESELRSTWRPLAQRFASTVASHRETALRDADPESPAHWWGP